MLPIVIGVHFTRDVEMLIRGSTSVTPHLDIDYTLRAIPNFHRALYAMSRLQIRDKDTIHTVNKRYYSARCYFERAIYFNASDEISFMLYGMHLHMVGDFVAAEEKYEEADKLGLQSAEFFYNRGLLAFDTGRFNEASKFSDRALVMGYPLMGLRGKLELLRNE